MFIHNRKADYRFDTNSSYLARIESIRTVEHPRVEGAIVSLKLTLSIEGKLVDGELKVPEGRLACEYVDFSSSYEPINQFGRQILSTISGPAFSSFEHLHRLKGVNCECTFGPPNKYTDFQPILSWSAAQNGIWSHRFSGAPFPPYLFRPSGTTYELRFSVGDFDEQGTYQACDGFHQYYQLLMAAGERISSIELMRRRPGHEHLPEKYAMDDRCPVERVLNVPGQELLDNEALRELWKRIHELEDAVEQARSKGDTTLQQVYENELVELRAVLKNVTYWQGKLKKVKFKDSREQSRKAVLGTLATAKKMLADEMPNLADHLDKYVKGLDYGYIYQPPSPAPRWQFS